MKGFDDIQGEEDEGGIDLTPMLDVVFIMLIFFIVTASFIKESGIEVNRPEAQTATKPGGSCAVKGAERVIHTFAKASLQADSLTQLFGKITAMHTRIQIEPK